ncbi:MAG: KOW motif-containing protein, partial [Bryobacterales bacterium]|nr:KOW motif-containing protein [Bryobacterales bacterium]
MPSKKELNKIAARPVKTALRKNDLVKVITGRDKGKTGRVIEINRSTGRVVVE